MANVVDYEEFEQLREVVLAMKAENDFLRSVLIATRWLSKPQTLKALSISETTLWRLTKAEQIKNYREGSKYFYDIDAVRELLMRKKFDKTVAENRIIQALYAA